MGCWELLRSDGVVPSNPALSGPNRREVEEGYGMPAVEEQDRGVMDALYLSTARSECRPDYSILLLIKTRWLTPNGSVPPSAHHRHITVHT